MKWPSLLISLILAAACTKPPMLSKAKSGEEAFAECHALTEDKNYEKANQCHELLKNRYPGTPESIEAGLEAADNLFRQKEYLVAVESYKSFARLHPSYEKIDYVYYRTGLAYLKESPKAVDRDQQYLDDAIHYFSLVLNNPKSGYRDIAQEKWNEARRKLGGRSYYIGRFYFRTGEYIAAIPRFEEVILKYSGLGLDEKALYFLGRSYLKLNERERAAEVIGVFDQHYPRSPYRSKLARKAGMP